jgi:hypothetical protein
VADRHSLRVRAADCTPFHPVLESPVAGAAALAITIGKRDWTSREALAAAVARVAAQANVQRDLLADVIEGLLDGDPKVRRAALRCVYRGGADLIAKINAGCVGEAEADRLNRRIGAVRERLAASPVAEEAGYRPVVRLAG